MAQTSRRVRVLMFGAYAAALTALVWSTATRPAAQELPKIWTGVYTEEQVKHGREVFNTRCAHCHDENLTGGDGPALVGAHFSRNWGSRTVNRLFMKIRDRMPPGESFVATEKEKLDIVTYLLTMNGFPMGSKELTTDPDLLNSLLIVGKNGPEPAPTGAMVEVVGCLITQGADYALSPATDPVVSTMDDPAGDAKAFKGSLGTVTVKMLDVFPKPDALKGHMLMAKGLLIRKGAEMSLNVLALEQVKPTCP